MNKRNKIYTEIKTPLLKERFGLNHEGGGQWTNSAEFFCRKKNSERFDSVKVFVVTFGSGLEQPKINEVVVW